MEELRTYCEITDHIELKLMEKAGRVHSGWRTQCRVFTREQLAARLRFLVPALVKQFLHFTRAPPALIHPNTIRILTGYSVLNLSYQVDLSLVEICFIYALKVGQGGRLSMSVRSARLQIVNGLPDSPKMEAEGALLVRGPWDETPGSLGLPFRVNRSQSFPGVYW